MSNRLFVALVLCVFVVCASGASSAQGAGEPPFTLRQVGPNVWAAISNPKSKVAAGANTGFVIGDDGIAVIDTTESIGADGNFGPEPAKQLLAAIRKLSSLPVKFVINTHYHLDHVGTNGIFVDAGATVLAHRNVRGWLHGENLRMMGKDIKPQHRTFIETLLPPTVTYDQTVDLYLGARQIRVQSLPGHTGGDSVVLIPDAKVVFAGDLFWRNMLPNLMDASTQPWVDTLDGLAKAEPDATFVPGHGDVGNAQDVVSFRHYLATLRKLVSDGHARGLSGEMLADAVMLVLRETYNRWDGFGYLARPNILETEAELRGTKRIPQAQPAK